MSKTFPTLGFALCPFLHALCVVCALFLDLCAAAHAQQPKKVPRIGYISSTDRTSESRRYDAIRAGLREFGYIEGQNIAIEYRSTDGKHDRALQLAAELVRLKVDIIVVAGGEQWGPAS